MHMEGQIKISARKKASNLSIIGHGYLGRA